jgi:hypothetical protein
LGLGPLSLHAYAQRACLSFNPARYTLNPDADTLLTKKELPGCTPGQRRALRDFRRRALLAPCAADLLWDELFTGLWVAHQEAACASAAG